MKRFCTALLLLLSAPLVTAADLQQLLQLVDYVGVDYAEAVADGEVINPAEYAEMQDFAAGIARQVAGLPAGTEKTALTEQSAALARLVDARAAPAEVNALTARMRLAVIEGYQVSVVPRQGWLLASRLLRAPSPVSGTEATSMTRLRLISITFAIGSMQTGQTSWQA